MAPQPPQDQQAPGSIISQSNGHEKVSPYRFTSHFPVICLESLTCQLLTPPPLFMGYVTWNAFEPITIESTRSS